MNQPTQHKTVMKPSSIGPILMETNRMTSKEQVKDWLKLHQSDQLKFLLVLANHPQSVWALPEGIPPYKEDELPWGNHSVVLWRFLKDVALYMKTKFAIPNQVKRESAFVNNLQQMHKDEARILCAVKDKKLETVCKWLTYDFVCDMFPNSLPKKEAKKESPLVASVQPLKTGTGEPSGEPKKSKGGRPKGSKNKRVDSMESKV